ncbi:glycerophosphodiester phosphodiesterase family protein [Pseudoclavibacter terrae]|uniref:glycerophosphodiester phosphodiesterase n=1 Tax=Pseudoclavibacter terrae TaxID=1530195 RepID=A0A7J5B5I2_9MICO|nr:glycerophosphodiester phosphodiesterase family protein [Pseudoclavibacter terrae]KAB1639373.1 glycerophosphodiester phosphodiesterase [Pseudoclavibacter terrae]
MNAPSQHKCPMLIGHRGAPAYRPEHTAEGYLLAVRQGADALEPDVVPTRDGVLLVRHEPMLGASTDIAARTTEFGPARTLSTPDGMLTDWFAHDFTWEQLGSLRALERIPRIRPVNAVCDGTSALMRLRELVQLVEHERTMAGARPRLVIELKHASWFRGLGFDLPALLERELAGLWGSPALEGLVIESFEGEVLRDVRRRGVAADASLVYLLESEGVPHDRLARDGAHAQSYASDLTSPGLDAVAEWADGISPSHLLLGVRDEDSAAHPQAGRRLVERAHARGLEVYTWTLRPEDVFLPQALAGRPETYWRGILRTGVDGVFADAPDRVRALIDAQTPRA